MQLHKESDKEIASVCQTRDIETKEYEKEDEEKEEEKEEEQEKEDEKVRIIPMPLAQKVAWERLNTISIPISFAGTDPYIIHNILWVIFWIFTACFTLGIFEIMKKWFYCRIGRYSFLIVPLFILNYFLLSLVRKYFDNWLWNFYRYIIITNKSS